MRTALAVTALAVAGAIGFSTASTLTTPETVTDIAMGCNDWAGQYTQRECFAAGTLVYALKNIQPAAQFCKWKAANPGEWTRLTGYASTGTHAERIVTWFGASLLNNLEAYFAIQAPTFSLPLVPLPPNACGGKIIAPPVVGVTPGQTDATVTITTTP